MTKQLKYKNVTWIDLESPSKEELTDIARKYNIHSLVLEELSCPSTRSRVDSYEDYLYLILHFPACENCYAPGADVSLDPEEIDFVIGKDFLITVHYRPLAQLEELAQIFEMRFGGDKHNKEMHGGYLFFHIIRTMYQALEGGLDYTNKELRNAEHNVFAGKEREMVSTLSDINRKLIDCRWALKSHHEVLTSLELAARDFFGKTFDFHLRAIIGEYEKIWAMLENNRDIFTDIRQTNESLLSIKTNETMRVLTATAFVFFPLTMVTGVFGMSSDFVPFMNQPYGFFFVLVMMLVVLLGMYTLAKKKQWL